MKFCYCDESGTGDEPIAVMVGIVVDAQRMHVSKNDWTELLNLLSSIVNNSISEIHTRDFYSGNGVWRNLDGPQRSKVINAIFKWLVNRRHHIVYSSLNKDLYYKNKKDKKIYPELATPWRFMGMHLLLSIQKTYQSSKKKKGNTVFIFDNEEREKMRFTDLIFNPPEWTDSYYNKENKQSRLDQIVDVPYFGDSKEVGLIQVADLVAYLLRCYAEISEGYSKPKYTDELKKLTKWMGVIKDRCINGSAIYPAINRCDCTDLFYSHAPKSIRTLHRS